MSSLESKVHHHVTISEQIRVVRGTEDEVEVDTEEVTVHVKITQIVKTAKLHQLSEMRQVRPGQCKIHLGQQHALKNDGVHLQDARLEGKHCQFIARMSRSVILSTFGAEYMRTDLSISC